MNNKDIFEDFLETEVYEKIKKSYNIIFTSMVGSRRYGIEDEFSDFDILIFVDDSKVEGGYYYNRHYLKHKDGIRCHWYIKDIKAHWFDFYFYNMFLYSDILIGENPVKKIENQKKYDKFRGLIEGHEKDFLEMSIYQNITKSNYFKIPIKEGEINEENATKHFYRIIMIWEIYNERFDELDKDFITKLKRIRWLDKEYKKTEEYQKLKDKAYDLIVEINEHFKNYDESNIEEVEKMILDFYKEIKEV